MLDSNGNGKPTRPFPVALSEMVRASDGLLDLLPVATFICDANGVILQYNKRAVEIWGRKPAPGQTHQEFSGQARFYELEGGPHRRSAVFDVLESGLPVREAERVVQRPDGATIVVSLNIDPLRDGDGKLIGVVSCITDITERKRMDSALEQSSQLRLEQEQRLAATYEHVSIGISEVLPDGRFVRVNEAICSITGRSREELLSLKLFTDSAPEDSELDRQSFLQQVAGELEFYSVEKRYQRKDGRVIWLSVRSSPVRDSAGKLLYVVRVVQDISERKAAERRQKLLIDELNHRVKNTLARVQSLASQTARAASTPDEFRDRFEGRLIALSKAHDQLTLHHWENADLRAVLDASLAPYAGRVGLRGDNIMLRPRAVLSLAMAFHELTTNAEKYGALSVPGGHIDVTWQTVAGERADAPPLLQMTWIERDGPPVAEPQRRGFGSKLIESGIAAELGGSARIVYDPSGLRCEIAIPIDTATAARQSAEMED